MIEAICKAAYTGKIGDGKIFVYDLLQAVRIRPVRATTRRFERAGWGE